MKTQGIADGRYQKPRFPKNKTKLNKNIRKKEKKEKANIFFYHISKAPILDKPC